MSQKNMLAKVILPAVLVVVSTLASACFESKSEASGQDNAIDPAKNADKATSTRSSPSDDALQVINDPRKDSPPVKVSAASAAFIKRTLLPGLKAIWGAGACDENFKILAAANGSFTESNAVQTAYLYQYCQKDNVLVKDGIAIFQDSKLVENIAFSSPEISEDENIVYENGYASDLSMLKDINKNGVDELAMYYGSYEGGAFVTAVDILEVPNKTLKQIGTLGTYYYNNYQGEGYRITVKPGKTPMFYSETYKQDNEKWTKTGTSKAVKLRHNEINKYQIVG